MRSPLTVRVADGVRDQQVTRFVKGLRFTKTAPGGHHSAAITIDAPEGLFGDLGNADRVYIYDGRNASTVWDGYVENPGRQTVSGGDRYDLSAMGGVVLTSDNARPVVFVSTDLSHSHWQKSGDVKAATSTLENLDFNLGPSLRLQIPSGTPIDGGDVVSMINTMFLDLDQPIHRVSAVRFAEAAPSGYYTSIGLYYGASLTSAPVLNFDIANLSNVPSQAVMAIDPGNFAFTSYAAPSLIIGRNAGAGATTVSDDATFATFFAVTLRPGLRDAAGDYVIAEEDDAVYAHEVVNHLIGEGVLTVDAASAVVEQATSRINNLAYLDGVKPRQILDDLTLYEPDHLWEILESGSNGKHRFNYRQWPTTPRYEISGREFTETGGEQDLCNRITVSWKDSTGAEQVTIRTSVVEALGARVKDAEPITLPDGQGSQANAERIGDEVLAALGTLSRAGTAIVDQPILDRLTGLMAMPWEIEPGHLVRVRDRGIDLQLTEMTYEDESCTASLTLGSPTLSLAQRIAGLGR